MIGEQLLIANYSLPQLLIANFPNIGNYSTKALQRENIVCRQIELYLMKHAVNLKILIKKT